MSRKVFLSFLGTTDYQPSFYIAYSQEEKEIESTRFIQKALITHYCKNFTLEDKIFIFTTEGALTNYNDLEEELNKLNLFCDFRNIDIPDGKTTEEIWAIFLKIFNNINKDDELIFDITHGFRSLPMLNMVLINYAKLLKNITVKGIYYGNWEARYEKSGKIYSPIWDLKDFEQLQEWTNAAQLFLKAGSAENLSMMMKKRNMIGSDEIESFSQEILSNRGINLSEGKSALAIKNILFERNNEAIHPVVKPIFELIENQFTDYKEDSILNGLFAVKWCIDHNLIQQGYTIMSEFLPTYVLNYISVDYKDKDARNTINGFLSISGKIEKFNFNDDVGEKQKEWLDKAVRIPYFKKLCERNRSINAQNRDDINHGGFRNNPKTYDEFRTELKDKYEKLLEVILKIESEK